MIDPTNPDYTSPPVSPRRPRFEYRLIDPSVPPCVTIVTPFYNTGSIFHETAYSVLQQSLQQWEWLIINDGSTDLQSLAILDSYRQSDSRIRVIDHDANRGPSAARNTGFREAQSSYIVQLDSDNLLEPTAMEKWLWFLTSYPEFAFVKGYSVGFGAQEYLWENGFHNGSAFLEDNLVDATSTIRKAVHEAVGGYDEDIRGGLEDWDFWLHCASHGYWGGTIPEYLDWYRRRPTHSDRWADWDNAGRQQAFHTQLRQRYAHLWNGGFPKISPSWHMPHEIVPDVLPCDNRLSKDNPRLLLLVPWLTMGGADKFNLDVLEQLTGRGWQVSVATTLKGDHAWLPHFARYTLDIFILHRFLRLIDYPRFLCYLIHSRQIDVVFIANSELAYLLLPYLRAHCPSVVFVDFCHMEEEYWKNGGYPRLAVEYQDLLDVNIVSSEHLKEWMVTRGADSRPIQVCYTNINPDQWRPDPQRRAVVRKELNLDAKVPVVLYAGRICEQKQPRVFAKTMLHLMQESIPCVALVAGNGPEQEWLRSFIKRHGLGAHVRLLDGVSNERICELMMAADVFFLPSQWEGIALSVYEAMACALPVVGADVGGQQELVTPECGILIARGDEEAETQWYAKTLTKLLRDPQRLKAMGHAGRVRVCSHFHIEQMGERLVGLLQKAMRLHRAQSHLLPSLGLAKVCATQAVEYTRLTEVADGLWRERERTQEIVPNYHSLFLDPYGDSWRTLAYFAIRRFLFPYYRAALDRDITWLLPLKDKLKRALLHGGQA